MSNVVRTWEDEANTAGEIELTDAQLAAVVGAWDGNSYSSYQPSYYPSYQSSYHPDCEGKKYHKEFEKKVKVCIEFEYEEECKKEGEYKKYWN